MALGVVGTAGAGGPKEHAPTGLLVFAAASLSDALEEVDRAFTARTGVRVSASYAASSVLAKQIEAGAPADAFFSADLAWVDYLEERGSSAARVARCSATRWCSSPRPTARCALTSHRDLIWLPRWAADDSRP
ncbi:MAG TPA: molybdate ABC transporter substrate-binding protein, partial [Steroidobacteraceae bacterium]|nr:molybdate ABC transporter substrate-binding protein [Steroidobacteraceae bacterium]